MQGWKFVGNFNHDGRYLKTGSGFLKLDKNNKVLVSEVRGKLCVTTILDIKMRIYPFYTPSIVHQKEVDKHLKYIQDFLLKDARCDLYNMENKNQLKMDI